MLIATLKFTHSKKSRTRKLEMAFFCIVVVALGATSNFHQRKGLGVTTIEEQADFNSSFPD